MYFEVSARLFWAAFNPGMHIGLFARTLGTYLQLWSTCRAWPSKPFYYDLFQSILSFDNHEQNRW